MVINLVIRFQDNKAIDYVLCRHWISQQLNIKGCLSCKFTVFEVEQCSEKLSALEEQSLVYKKFLLL